MVGAGFKGLAGQFSQMRELRDGAASRVVAIGFGSHSRICGNGLSVVVSGGFGVCGEIGLILVAGVAAAGGGEMAAWVLPCLALAVPMESKL